MKVNFTRSPGRVVLRDGVVRGPVLGGTIDGSIDYARDKVHLRGTLVPLYGANNLFGRIPVVGPVPRRRERGAGRRHLSRWWASRAIRCSTSILSRRWRPDCCARCSNFRQRAPSPTAADRTPVDAATSAWSKRKTATIPERSSVSHRLEQDVTLPAEREFDHAVGRDVGFADQ